MRFFYTFLIYLLHPLLFFFLWKKNKSYPLSILNRYGFYPQITPSTKNGLLIHASSVGEVLSAIPLIKKLKVIYPNLSITLTCMTPTGLEQAKQKLANLALCLYIACDMPFAIKRMLNFIQPQLCLIVETELWPNFIYHLNKKNIPIVIINARLSIKSFANYKKFSFALNPILQKIDKILAQDIISAERFEKLGVNKQKIEIIGNLKYVIQITAQQKHLIQQLQNSWDLQRKILILGSSHQGEEEIILDAYKQLLISFPDLLLIIVPRHPKRFKLVENLLKQSKFSYVTRSSGNKPDNQKVLLVDTIGELQVLYALADIAIVGGSLVNVGGHNPLEPILFKKPVIMGKYTDNFTQIINDLYHNNGIILVDSSSTQIINQVTSLFNNHNKYQNYIINSQKVLLNNQKSLQQVLIIINNYLNLK